MDAVSQVLRWAAGADITLTDPEFDDRTLLSLIEQHALTGRLLRRLPTGPIWLRRRLNVPVATRYRDTLARAATHVRAVDAIVAELGEQAPPPILVKGIAAGVLTGNRHLLRCGDIDLVCADGDALIAALTRLGYERTRDPFLHELGEFTRDGIEIDVHAYVPVPGYGSVRHADLTPPAPGDVWHQPRRTASMHPIRHDQFDSAAVSVGRVRVPDPCLQAIVLCAHAFLNFTNMWSLSHRSKPYVKLAELADLTDLARHEAFDPARFEELVTDLDAWDAVRWAGWASTTLIGGNPLPVPAGTGPFPRCLWWDFWARLPVDVDTLLLPGWFDVAAVRALLADRIELSTGRPAPPWTIEVRRDDEEVTVVVGLPAHTDAATERGRVDLGVTGTEWVLTGGHLTAVGGHRTCDLLPGRRIRVRFDAPAAAGDVLVAVAEQEESGALRSAVLLPAALLPTVVAGAR